MTRDDRVINAIAASPVSRLESQGGRAIDPENGVTVTSTYDARDQLASRTWTGGTRKPGQSTKTSEKPKN